MERERDSFREGGGFEGGEREREREMASERCMKSLSHLVPFQMNVGGASDRPVPADIWTIVQLKMDGQASEQEIQHAYTRVRRRGLCSACAIM